MSHIHCDRKQNFYSPPAVRTSPPSRGSYAVKNEVGGLVTPLSLSLLLDQCFGQRYIDTEL